MDVSWRIDRGSPLMQIKPARISWLGDAANFAKSAALHTLVLDLMFGVERWMFDVPVVDATYTIIVAGNGWRADL